MILPIECNLESNVLDWYMLIHARKSWCEGSANRLNFEQSNGIRKGDSAPLIKKS